MTDPTQHTHDVVRKAFHADQACELVKRHNPLPVMTEHHHSKPQYLQMKLWGEIRFGPDLWVCSNCHDSIHAWLYGLLGEHRKPTQMPIKAKAEAERTYAWYLSELNAHQ